MFGLFKKTKPLGTTIKLSLSGLHCTSCAFNIDEAIEELTGVHAVSTSYAKSECVVDFDPAQTNPNTIISQIKKLGYNATLLKK